MVPGFDINTFINFQQPLPRAVLATSGSQLLAAISNHSWFATTRDD